MKTKFYTQILKIITVIVFCTSCGRLYGQANTQNPNLILASIKYEPPPPPPTSGEPTGRAQGGAGRGCEPTALVPVTKSKNGNLLWGLTVAERPQFWFALPRKLTKQDAVEFVLKDNQGKEVYKTTSKSETPLGLVSFTIPKTVPSLQIGKSYNWSFAISCDFQTVEDKPGTVEGSIQRIATSTNLKNQLAGATPVEQASIYAQNGIWFDALSILAVNKRDKNSSAAWTELLRQVNLEKFASLPITECCGS
jgi:Domain of Unknown Function (DUF928)